MKAMFVVGQLLQALIVGTLLLVAVAKLVQVASDARVFKYEAF